MAQGTDLNVLHKWLRFRKNHNFNKLSSWGSPWSSCDHTVLATRKSMVQIPLEEENISPFRFFFWREPLNPSLPSEKMFKSPRASLGSGCSLRESDMGFLCQSRRWWVLNMVSDVGRFQKWSASSLQRVWISDTVWNPDRNQLFKGFVALKWVWILDNWACPVFRCLNLFQIQTVVRPDFERPDSRH